VSRTVMLIPLEVGVGVACVSLGIFRAMERHGVSVNFFKPVAQAKPGYSGVARSTEIIRRATATTPPEPISMLDANDLISHDRVADLLENIVKRFKTGTAGAEVVVVEGLVPTSQNPFAAELNYAVAKALNADIVFVTQPGVDSMQQSKERVELALSAYGGHQNERIVGCIFNKVGAPPDHRLRPGLNELPDSSTQIVTSGSDDLQILGGSSMRMLGCVPWNAALAAPRAIDLAKHLGAEVVHEGDLNSRRLQSVAFCARSVPKMVDFFRPGALLVTSGDRPDVILAACLAAGSGVKIGSILLTGNIGMDAPLFSLCEHAIKSSGLPILLTSTNTWETAQRLQSFNSEIPVDDAERIERVQEFFASHVDTQWVESLTHGSARPLKLSPPAFRYHLVELASAVTRRIVLPEGEEPRTIKAAEICALRGIAVPVLLGDPETIRRVAEQEGVILREGIDIINPAEVAERYVGPMVELRKSKGLHEVLARELLLDNVVLGTMMLAQNDVDGLVSGAVHTTANTIRPALQLIKTAPGANLVSSIFFMLLPDQVLVYGDCAINPDPTAEQLADIAIQSASSAEAFGLEPRVAMISYSTGSSGKGAEVEKVREATRIAQELRPDLIIDGPLQYDAAIMENVARSKAPDSPVAGRATVFIFPDLNTGNTTYKAVQRSANLTSIGPMLQGIRKPVNDLSRGALVDDIVYTIALTAIQATQAMAVK
jgi:phosphate acetyltransferase